MNFQPLTLSLETATLAGSISISRGPNILASSSGDPAVSHSNTLLADIDELFSRVNLSLREIELFAVASGPGSFTGLRIGLATVKALAVTMNRPCVGVPTLEAIAHSAGSSEATVTLLPAGRGEVFAQMFSMDLEGLVTELDEPAHLSPTRMVARYIDHGGIRWAGDGAQMYSSLIRESAVKAGHRFLEGNNGGLEDRADAWRIVEPALNLAEHVASLALLEFGRDNDRTASSLRAIYVRPSDAEMKS